MSLLRFLRHASTGHWRVRHCFPEPALAAIAAAVKDCEQLHPGEIRFVIEAALPAGALCEGVTPRQRALEVFAQQRVWDTEHNNGVLIYLLLADRAIEIVADRYVARGSTPCGLSSSRVNGELQSSVPPERARRPKPGCSLTGTRVRCAGLHLTKTRPTQRRCL